MKNRAVHALIVLHIVASAVNSDKLPKIRIEWPESNRGEAAPNAYAPLLQDDEDRDHSEDV